MRKLQYNMSKNEKILWVGKPKLVVCAFESVTYGSFFILLGWNCVKDKTEWVRIIGLISILFGLLVALLQFLSRAKTVYMITNERIISNVFLGIGVKRYITHNEISKIKIGQSGLNILFKTKYIGFFIGEQARDGDIGALADVYRKWNYIENVEEAIIILKKKFPSLAPEWL